MKEAPEPRQYFSERQGRGPKAAPLPFESVRKLVVSEFDRLRELGYMQEAFGVECTDGDADGSLGSNPDAHFTRTIMREGIWPYWHRYSWTGQPPPPPYESWDADTLFDVIEVVHDLVSKPLDGTYHAFNDCGMHYETFNQIEGQVEFRRGMNQILRLNDPPYEMDDRGQIVEAAPTEFRQLLGAPVPAGTSEDLVTSKINAAVERFRARGATLDDRRHAVRDLADVLEAIRRDIKDAMLPADEKALFHIANGFSVRHNNRDQRGDYDRLTWLRWAFYVYLATIHAVLRVRRRTQ
jgi:hypothetical protein